MIDNESTEITSAINEMIDSKRLDDIKLAKEIISSQPDLIDGNLLKGHWYDINELKNPNTIEYSELYYTDGGSSDKVYLLFIDKVGEVYLLRTMYGKRGKKLRTNSISSKNKYHIEREYNMTIQNKKAKGYTKL